MEINRFRIGKVISSRVRTFNGGSLRCGWQKILCQPCGRREKGGCRKLKNWVEKGKLTVANQSEEYYVAVWLLCHRASSSLLWRCSPPSRQLSCIYSINETQFLAQSKKICFPEAKTILSRYRSQATSWLESYPYTGGLDNLSLC